MTASRYVSGGWWEPQEQKPETFLRKAGTDDLCRHSDEARALTIYPPGLLLATAAGRMTSKNSDRDLAKPSVAGIASTTVALVVSAYWCKENWALGMAPAILTNFMSAQDAEGTGGAAAKPAIPTSIAFSLHPDN